MTTRVKRIGVWVALLALLGFFAFSLRSDVSLKVHDVSTAILPSSDALRGVADLELINRGREIIRCSGSRERWFVGYTVLYQGDNRREERGSGSGCIWGPEEELQPGESVRFQAWFDVGRPCKVRVHYRRPDRMPEYLRSLPRWADPLVDFLYCPPQVTSETIVVATQ